MNAGDLRLLFERVDASKDLVIENGSSLGSITGLRENMLLQLPEEVIQLVLSPEVVDHQEAAVEQVLPQAWPPLLAKTRAAPAR